MKPALSLSQTPVLLSMVLVLFLVACGAAAPDALPSASDEVKGAPLEETSTTQPPATAPAAIVESDSSSGTAGSASSGQNPVASNQAESPTATPAPASPKQDSTSGSAPEEPATDPSKGEASQSAQSDSAPAPPPTDDYTGPVGGKIGDRAAEIEGIKAWLNSQPLTLAELRGKVVLVDFWTYTCINCIRTFPFLKLWHSRYADDGLVIIGVHSPEFEFEKDLGNVTRATQEDGIIWPVALDNDFVTWRNYSNRFWPAKYLVDKNGEVRYSHFGEGRYAETEEKIRELLLETGAEFVEGDIPLPADQTVDPTYLNTRGAEVTRELYGGYQRGYNDLLYGRGGYVKPQAYYKSPDKVVEFESSGDLEPHKMYFDGPWLIGPESIKHGRETDAYQDALSLVYSAVSVNAVLTSESGDGYKVRVTVGGEYLTEENKGEDIIIGSDGESYLMVNEARLYRILKNPQYKRRELLALSSNSSDFGLFAFTFGVYQTGA